MTEITQLINLFIVCSYNAFTLKTVWILNYCRSVKSLWRQLTVCLHFATLTYCWVRMISHHSAISTNQQVC